MTDNRSLESVEKYSTYVGEQGGCAMAGHVTEDSGAMPMESHVCMLIHTFNTLGSDTTMLLHFTSHANKV